MEHLLTIYIRTKARLVKGSVKEDGTVQVTKKEMFKLGVDRRVNRKHWLVQDVDDAVLALKQKGEIKGYGDNFKVLKEEGDIQPSLLELTGVVKKKRKREDGPGSTERYLIKIGKGGGSKRFKEFLSSKPMDKYLSTRISRNIM